MASKSNEWQSPYIDILREIMLRERVIDDLLFGNVALGRTPKFEFCYLELRMICELIAISSLIAHGDIPATKAKRMRSAWEADRILRIMSNLRPDFFPLAVMPTADSDGGTTFVDNPNGVLTQGQLISLYRECGKILHRGNLASFGQIKTSKAQFVKVGRWAKRLKALVSSHMIAGYEPDGLFLWLIMVDENLQAVWLRLKRIGDLSSDGAEQPQSDISRSEKSSSPDDSEG
jgi:hypothetical protein